MAVDNLLTRYRNLTVLAIVLVVQLIGLAAQIKRPTEGGSTRLVRVWSISIITPVEKAVVHTEDWFGHVWRDYFALRKVHQENEALKEENQRLRLESVRLIQDANQARRLQALLGFKEQFIEQTLPAQVISTTGSEFSRGIYIDKGSRDGVKVDMPVITPDGIVGKVYRVYGTSALVLEINDLSSGAGVILEKSRLQGIVKGNAAGETLVHNIMADEHIEVGERILTSGGDRIFPKGMPVGVVSSVSPGPDLFLTVRVKPAANLSSVEEVLVITKITEKLPDTQDLGPRQRAADILAERLPSVPPKPPEVTPGTAAATGSTAPGTKPAAGAQTNTPGATKPAQPQSAPGTALKPATSQPVQGTGPKPTATTSSNPAAPKPAGTTPKPQVPTGTSTKPAPTATPNAAAPKPAGATSKPQVPTGTATKPATTASPSAAAPKPAGTTAKPQVPTGTATKPATTASPSAAAPKPAGTTAKPQAQGATPAGAATTPLKKPATTPPAGQNNAAPKTTGPGTATGTPAGATTTKKPSTPKPEATKPDASKPDASKPGTPATKDTPRQ